MRIIARMVGMMSRRARQKRAEIFRQHFALTPDTRILDLGSEDGTHIAAVLKDTSVRPSNVHIADISEEAVRRGQERYGFVPVVLPEVGPLPFEDGSFDIVFCSSVIEHVTIPKAEVWSLRSGREFRERAWRQQQEFAREIARISRGYFVQTPNRWFPIESHTWLPFVGFLPRGALCALIKVTNRVWVKKTSPDWNLLSPSDLQRLFPDAEIVREVVLGFTESIMAIRRVPPESQHS